MLTSTVDPVVLTKKYILWQKKRGETLYSFVLPKSTIM